MQPFKVILADVLQEGTSVPVATAHSINLNFNNYGETGNDLSEGNFSISGRQTLLLADNSKIETVLPAFEIRLKELENVIPTLTGQAKTDAQAKFDIWSACLAGIQSALDTAMKAQHAMDQQVASLTES